MTFVSGDRRAQGSCSQASGTVTCSLGHHRERRQRQRPDQGHAAGRRARSRTRRASRPASADPIPANNSASAVTTVDPVADLSITKSDSPDPVSVRAAAHLHARPSATPGLRSAAGVTVTDTLPGGVTYNSATPSQGSCSHASGTVTCSLGTLASGANASVADHRAPDFGKLDHQPGQRVRADRDPVLVNNAASATTTVDPVADLSLTKSRLARPGPVRPAAHLHADRAQRRAGERAPSVSLSDSLPAGVTFVSATATQGSCVRVGNTVTCALGTIASGATVDGRDQGRRGRAGDAHQRRHRAVHGDRPQHGQQLRDRGHDGASRSPTSGLTKSDCARPGAGRSAAHLHPGRLQRGPAQRRRA